LQHHTNGTGAFVGGLVGCNGSSITRSYSTGSVKSFGYKAGWGFPIGYPGPLGSVGGLVGDNYGSITMSHSTGTVSGATEVGGLVGFNQPRGSITLSYSTATVKGGSSTGGLVGRNYKGHISNSNSTGSVSGDCYVGGLVGSNSGNVVASYSICKIIEGGLIGGLVGRNSILSGEVTIIGSITSSFWDMESSGQATSDGGTGLTTAEMQNIDTFLSEGWDIVDEIINGTCDYWQISPDDYPRLSYHTGESPVMPEGLGTAEQPYLIQNARDLGTVWFKPLANYRLAASLDLSGIKWTTAVIPQFGGTFDGNGHIISNLHIRGSEYLGLFGQLGFGAKISNLGLEVVDVNATGNCAGCLAGLNYGHIATSYSKGIVSGSGSRSWHEDMQGVGGLVGINYGRIIASYSIGTISGKNRVGGLVGRNASYDTGGVLTNCYSIGTVSTSGYSDVGGLVGYNDGYGSIISSFWDTQTSGQDTSDGGIGKTTAEMQSAITFLIWGTCGNEGIWTIDEGRDYPRLWWENKPGEPIAVGATLSEFLTGSGTKDSPYLIYKADELNLIGLFPCDWDKHFKLMADIDLSGFAYDTALIAPDTGPSTLTFDGIPFTGVFDGNGHTISHLSVTGLYNLGLFGQLKHGGEIRNLGVVNVNIVSSGWDVGGLVGDNYGGTVTNCYCTGIINVNGSGQHIGGIVGYNSKGIVSNCYSAGTVTGTGLIVGGLVGLNSYGDIRMSYSISLVNGDRWVGGLVGVNTSESNITASYSTGTISGDRSVGGLVGLNEGSITKSYSTGTVMGNEDVGGLVGDDSDSGYGRPDIGSTTASFWDMETSGQSSSAGGTGKTKAEMQIASIFLEAGWDFVDETENGTEDIWWILEGKDFPRLSWEAHD
ncbi:GLUG motif-containing protein, partial [Planctomycetota bacterium]